MFAFVALDNGRTLKAYRHGYDWQIIGPDIERWFSVWQGNERESLDRAFAETAAAMGAHVVETIRV